MIPINPSGSSFDANEPLGVGRDPHDSETTHPVDEAEHPVHPDEAGLSAQALPPVPGPKYEQVIRLLEQRYIIPGSPGDKLPTERALQLQFGVSRQTVRNALKYLLDKGLIYNQQGSGTYVAAHSQASFIPRICSYAEDMSRRGMEPSTRMIATRWVEADERISSNLLVPVGSQVLYARRLRLANGTPIGFERVYLVPDAASTVLDPTVSQAFAGGSPQEEGSEYTVEHGRMRIEASLFSEQDAADFNGFPTVGAAALQVTLTGYTGEGEPVEYSVTLYESAAYFYEMIL